AVCAACGTGAVASAARAVAHSVTEPPGSARRTAAFSRAASRPDPATSMKPGPGGWGPRARQGNITTPFPVGSKAPGTLPTRPATRIVTVLMPTMRLAGARPTSRAAAAVATAGTAVAFPGRVPVRVGEHHGQHGPGGQFPGLDQRGGGGNHAGHRGDLALDRGGDHLT